MPFIATTAVADFGSKYRDLHRRDAARESVREKPDRPSQASVFPEMEDTVSALENGAIEATLGGHVNQAVLEALPPYDAYVLAFEEGDELFEINYNALDGVGVNVGNGQRFTALPRLDLKGPDAWASVLPHRMTGPNSDSCISCHNLPVADGAGGVNDNAIRIDPERKQRGFIHRQAPHMFGFGAVQLLAEEMTTELNVAREQAIAEACAMGRYQSVELTGKNVGFGTLRVSCNNVDYSQVEGIDQDLILKPFEWKGLTAFARDFLRGAAHQELGMQATELVGDNDSDFDGVQNELSVGDLTALTIYSVAQPRPVTRLELNQIISYLNAEEMERYDLPLQAHEIRSIENGEKVFEDMQCSNCHRASLTVAEPTYSEPSRHADFRDETFPAGSDVSLPTAAITFDLTTDILDNLAPLPSGQTIGQFERNTDGGAIVRLYGDLKRHDMGEELAEEIDEGNVGSSVFLTENLWGVGSTAPYLHDGRATTLSEAILYHGGEAADSKRLFEEASRADQANLIDFLNNLVLYLEP